MKNIIIIGAGGFGRELLQWIKDINKIEKKWNILGFVDDDADALKNKLCDYSVLGNIDSIAPSDEIEYVLAIANTTVKEAIVHRLSNKNIKFATIIHPTAMVSEFAVLGKGVVAYPHTCIGANAKIGDFVTLGNHTCVGHDAELGDYVTCFSFCDITGGVCVEEKVTMGSSVKIVPGRKIGKNAFLCAGSIVLTNVRPNTKMLGNPAKKVDF